MHRLSNQRDCPQKLLDILNIPRTLMHGRAHTHFFLTYPGFHEWRDLILLDIMMPGTPVSEIIEKIDDTKVLFLSAVEISETNKKKI